MGIKHTNYPNGVNDDEFFNVPLQAMRILGKLTRTESCCVESFAVFN